MGPNTDTKRELVMFYLEMVKLTMAVKLVVQEIDNVQNKQIIHGSNRKNKSTTREA